MTLYRVEMRRFVAGVVTDPEGVIVRAAPILSRFRGQHIGALKRWVARSVGGRVVEYPEVLD